MKKTVTIIDYGRGNLFSVARAIEVAGGTPAFTDDPDSVVKADRVALPGVGAFGDGMKGLGERGMIEALHTFRASGRPLLGICLGMQMLLEKSSEHGRFRGLGMITGSVDRLPQSSEGRIPKVPSVGWHKLVRPNGQSWLGTILEEAGDEAYVYFVHSFQAVPTDSMHVLATYRFGDHDVPAVIAHENVVGCQFHPEKSGQVGLRLWHAWLADERIYP